ncbi:MAG TPA: type IV pilus twitching motility protein PilT, partial [Candidatus Eisenbacteria bacterium]|nr:type IV pilus twitching motility protein PilT [Candidatus Eisenbacteria bacterium]
DLLDLMVDQNASDLHIQVGQPPSLRLSGSMTPIEGDPLTPSDTEKLMLSITPDAHISSVKLNGGADFGFAFGEKARFRVSVMKAKTNYGMVLRQIPYKMFGLRDIGLPDKIRELLFRPRGLILVTGPTGSGKSTTLAAMIDFVNGSRAGHILTIEDPIEFVHQSKRCLVNQREVGPHTGSFANALRAALREDPDIILVGELRDLETTSLAISAAETGHVVFATLHTNSAAKTIDRIIDIFPSGQQAQVRTMLSESLEGVVAQSLLPTKDGKGRVAALEVLVGVPALRNLIREDKTAQILSVIQTGAAHGMQSLDQSLRELFMTGKISRDEVMRRSNNPRLFEQGGPGSGTEIDPAQPRPASPRPAPASAANVAAAVAQAPPKKPGMFIN